MPTEPEEPVEVLRSVWQADQAAMEEIRGPQRSCRNMRDVSFDGFAEPGTDLGTAWRSRLRREGKLTDSNQTVRDLVLGSEPSR